MTDKQRNDGFKTFQVKVQGMHCGNCEVLIERKLKKIAGVRRVKASHMKGTAEITCYGDLDVNALQSAIGDDGYTVSPSLVQSSRAPDSTNTGRDYLEIGAVFLILVALYLVLGKFDVLPQNLAIPSNISYGLALMIGVVASLSTCIAVTGGLLVAVAAKYNEATTKLSGAQRFKPHIFFNAGRIVSYTLLGGAIGALGSTFTLSPAAGGVLMIFASFIMIALGLQMLG